MCRSVLAVLIAACGSKVEGPTPEQIDADVAAFFDADRQAVLGERFICGGEAYNSDRYSLVSKPEIQRLDDDESNARIRVVLAVKLAETTERPERFGVTCRHTRDLQYTKRPEGWRLVSWTGVVATPH